MIICFLTINVLITLFIINTREFKEMIDLEDRLAYIVSLMLFGLFAIIYLIINKLTGVKDE